MLQDLNQGREKSGFFSLKELIMRSFFVNVICVLVCVNLVQATAMDEIYSGYLGSGNIRYGAAQMVVAEASYMLPGEIIPQKRIVCAVGMGGLEVQLFTLDAVTSTLTPQETLTLLLPSGSLGKNVFDISILEIEIDTTGETRSCLVIPLYDTVTDSGDVYIFDLETRTPYPSCLDWNEFPVNGDVVHVGQHSSGSGDIYPISICGDIYNSHLVITNSGPKFVLDDHIVFGDCYYAASSHGLPARAYETYTNIEYFSSSLQSLAITTCHVGGAVLWNPQYPRDPEVGWIRVAQMGWYDNNIYLNNRLVCNSYLGDMHRVALLNDETGHPALLFCANTGMGFLVYDIHDPSEPKFVWQWDNDTRFFDESSGCNSFSWFGSGSDEVAPGFSPGSSAPGQVFGIGLNQDAASGMIHVFIGNGIDGLRAFDFSHFLSPFEYLHARIFRDFDIYHHSTLSDDHGLPMLAWEVRTFKDNHTGQTFVFTTWKDRLGTDEDPLGEIALTVHRDNNPSIPTLSHNTVDYSNMTPSLSISFSSSNPTREAIVFELSSPDEEAMLMVFDAYGRLVKRENPGFREHRAILEWDLADSQGIIVPNGVYFAMLIDRAGNSVSVKCMVIH